MTDYQASVTRLLHIDEENQNKLIDLNAREGAVFLIDKPGDEGDLAELIFELCRERIGKPATTVLTGSALAENATTAVPGANEFRFREADGTADAKRLDRFFRDAARLTTAKGDNPVFLSLGAVKWKIGDGKDGLKEILSPLILIPVRLIRSGGAAQPLTVEFADDDIYLNPTFYEKLKKTVNERFAERFPLPTKDLKTPIDPNRFDLGEYFARLDEYFEATASEGERAGFELLKNHAVISIYNKSDMAIYRDLERNKERILAHPAVRAMFFDESIATAETANKGEPAFVLPYDGRQERIIRRVLNGENLAVKCPPGTGKTQLIANLIAAMLASGKRVLFSSRKTRALAEVYNKLPAELKPFLLRLDYESEAETAKIDARVVHTSLQEARNVKSAESEGAVLAKRASANEKKYGALGRLKKYRENMFGERESFYSALTGYMKHMDLAPVAFELPGKALQITEGDFYGVLETVKRVSASYEKLTDGERIPIRLNPWYSVKPEYAIREETIKRAEGLKTEVGAILNRLQEAEARNKEIASVVKNFRLNVVDMIAKCPFDAEDAKIILKMPDMQAFAERLRRFSLELRVGSERIAEAVKKGIGIFEIDLTPGKALNGLKTVSNLDLRLLKQVAETPEIYNDQNGVLSEDLDLAALLNALRMYATSLSEAKNTAKSVSAVFTETVFVEKSENEALTESFDRLKRYVGSGESAPKALDFAGKRALKSAKARMKNPEHVDFPNVLNALIRVQNYNRYANQSAKYMEKARNLLQYPLTEDQATDLLKLLEAFCAEGKSGFLSAVSVIERELPVIEAARIAAGISDDTALSLGDLKELYRTAALRKKLEKEFFALKELLPMIEDGRAPEYYDGLGAAVEALDYLTAAEKATFDASARTEAERAEAVVRFGLTVKAIAERSKFPDFLQRFTAFYREAFVDNAYANPAEIRLTDLKEMYAYVGDRSHLAAAANYRVLLENEKRLNVTAFFRPFAQGQRRRKAGETFPELFEHSFYAIRIDAMKATLGESAYRMTRDSLETDLRAFQEAERELFLLNAARTAQLAASRFDAEAKEFDFLKTNTSYTSCRKLFSEKAEGIVKLKQCFILSPSSVSLLLRSGDYWDFDAAIIDDAGQMPPEYAVGIAARAKQCVVVGDENQMPPIRHFVRADDAGEDDGIVAGESTFELLKQRGTFPFDELNAHYRSRTETLIRYSQRRYYPEMATFPTAVPRGESLGLFDRFVEGATSAGGENEREAEEVVREIERHFERFFDGEKRTLARSVGVVTFGTKQRELILKIIKDNSALYEAIRDAEAGAEVAEQAFFVRTIETVQGQVTDDLILSVTYGRDANGKKSENFGPLNGKLGERIFNVAVTRAKYSVTLIHSIRADEIEAEEMRYLKEYLEEVEGFDADDAARQFVSGGAGDAFGRSVADVLAEAGVAEREIVFDYGETDNSIKIPVAVLNKTGTRALFGVWTEREPGKDCMDGMARYPEILRARDWALYEIFAFDWVRNYEAERKKLIDYAKKRIAAAQS